MHWVTNNVIFRDSKLRRNKENMANCPIRVNVCQVPIQLPFLHLYVPATHASTYILPNKGHYGVNDFVPCREVVPISEVSMGLKQVSFVERSSLSRRVPYRRFDCIIILNSMQQLSSCFGFSIIILHLGLVTK